MEIHFVDSNIFYYHLLQDKVGGPRAIGIIRRIRNELAFLILMFDNDMLGQIKPYSFQT